MEESILIVYGHSLSWNVSVILETSASLGESNDALAWFDQVHAWWSLSRFSQELSICKPDSFHTHRNWNQNFAVKILSKQK